MASPKLSNYLLSNRKRLALSQADVAHLINAGTGEKVCRHERFRRIPSLEAALAYEVIYKRSVGELFPGLYQKIEEEVAVRAKTLAEKAKGRKRDVLSEIAGLEIGNEQNQP